MMRFGWLLLFVIPVPCEGQESVTIRSAKLSLSLEIGKKAVITGMTANGQVVLSGDAGGYTSISVGGNDYSSLHLRSTPVVRRHKDTVTIDDIVYGGPGVTVVEKWTFIQSDASIRWVIQRNLSKPLRIDAEESPVFYFDSVGTWDGAYQGYGGLAWFYLFNERLCTYGVHTHSSSFWNGQTGNGLDVIVEAPGRQVAMKYTRTMDDRLAYGITTSDAGMLPRYDSRTNRRRFIRGKTDVWSSYEQAAGVSRQVITLRYFDVNECYGRGKFVGLDGSRISQVLGTIARIGVIDSLHFGGNSWHTPYGPICLHEQYIAQLGLGIDDPQYLKGYQSCLDFYRDHAIRPDGRVIARWAYTDEDMMPGQGNKYGFYEAQWGFLMDANPDFVTNVAELYDLTGDRHWVKGHQVGCEKALDWILARDRDGNGLVEMMTDSAGQKRASDWIDIIWASYENAFVNATLYHALIEWAAVERQLGGQAKALYYEGCAQKLKAAFNRPVAEGGFWDEERGCYIHWREKDGSLHGRNMVTPVNFMAIAYGICDDPVRVKGILDTIETQMERERLFFWPLCMTSYAPGEGNDWQFPFPNYENGDLFLSWGSVAVAAYARYKPALAVKYVRNVLDQYSKDGLAFQRYGRAKQNGLGDDILSGNSLSVVGLYQAIYGINPRYNRLYLEPHLTQELAGTELRYNFRGRRLTISLDMGSYAVGDGFYQLREDSPFGYAHVGDSLFFFRGSDETAGLKVVSGKAFGLRVANWDEESRQWERTGTGTGEVDYVVFGLAPGRTYAVFEEGKYTRAVKCGNTGMIRLIGSRARTMILKRE
jgi:hypothetical protein